MSFFTRFRQTPAQRPTTAPDDLTPENGDTPATDRAGDRAAAVGRRRGRRRVGAWLATTAASLLVLFALVAPNRSGDFTPGAFVRIPLEALAGVVLVLVLSAWVKARRVVAVLVGLTLGLLTMVKLLDMSSFAVLDRPFDLVLDWVMFDDAVSFVRDSYGEAGAIGSMVAAVLLVVAVLIFMTLSVLRLTALVVRHRGAASRAVAVLAVAWVACALLGAQVVAGLPVAGRSATDLVYHRAREVPVALRDQQVFAGEAAVDAFRDTPADQLLTGLRGKDVVFAFVESYGRDAVEDPEFAPQVNAVLDAGTQRLGAAGFASRSAFLSSSTSGGRSWLAHATLLSGLWINNQQRYRNLVSTDRFTLTAAFERASWRTVGVMPGTTGAWPEGSFYGYDRVYDAHNLGYRGPNFSWATMPDQYTLSAFERLERAAPNRPPLMAEIPLISSHAPWAHVPRLVDWGAIGDGSVYTSMATEGAPPDALWKDITRVRAEYRRSIEYTLNSLISYVEKYGDDKLVLVFLGDHQPAPIITGEGASKDVPITVVTRDRAVLERISGWGWQDGLRPAPQAPVWRMDAFRDRFLTAFGAPGAPAAASAAAPR